MLFFLVSFLSFLILITKPLPLKLPSWVNEMRLLSVLIFQEFTYHSILWLKNYWLVSTQILKFSTSFLTSKNNFMRIDNKTTHEERQEEAEMNVLDLPELALELILEKLSPVALINMSNVCTSLKDRCRSDHLWDKQFREKWAKLMSPVARREWESINGVIAAKKQRPNWLTDALSCVWPCSWFLKSKKESLCASNGNIVAADSVMNWYLALESGRLWFPAQVYNREQNGHVGFMLSCYDAELSYDCHTDTFIARYPPHGQRATNIEVEVKWDRLRAPPVETAAHDLHVSDCLHDLRPGDHIEIQWRRNKQFPYGWWYGVVGHLESCDGDEYHCRCFSSDTIILEFNQYSPGSRWRRTVIDRKDHREEGNETDGFYGGIRKLYDNHEIATWRRLWPTDVLE